MHEVGEPEDKDAQAGGGPNDGHDAEGEDGDEFDAAAFGHCFEVQEEDYWEGPLVS